MLDYFLGIHGDTRFDKDEFKAILGLHKVKLKYN